MTSLFSETRVRMEISSSRDGTSKVVRKSTAKLKRGRHLSWKKRRKGKKKKGNVHSSLYLALPYWVVLIYLLSHFRIATLIEGEKRKKPDRKRKLPRRPKKKKDVDALRLVRKSVMKVRLTVHNPADDETNHSAEI